MKYSIFIQKLHRLKDESDMIDPEILICDRLEEDINPDSPEEPSLSLDWDSDREQEVIVIC
jgi:hypothetical protein